MGILPALKTTSAHLLATASDSGVCWQVWQSEHFRWLQTESGTCHSAVDLRPNSNSILPHVQAMSLAWAFVEAPAAVLLAGLGGGDQLRQINRLWPQAKVDCVDLSGKVIELYRRYFSEFVTIKVGLKQQPIEQAMQLDADPYDIICIDILNDQDNPDCLWRPNFYESCQLKLSPSGVLVVNLLPKDSQQLLQLAVKLRQLFCRRMLFIPVVGCDNVILLLLNQTASFNNRDGLNKAIEYLQLQLGQTLAIDLDGLYRLNIKDARGELELWQY